MCQTPVRCLEYSVNKTGRGPVPMMLINITKKPLKISLSRNLNQNQISIFSKRIEPANVQMFSGPNKDFFPFESFFSLGAQATYWITETHMACLFRQSPQRKCCHYREVKLIALLSSSITFSLPKPLHVFIHSFDNDLSRAQHVPGVDKGLVVQQVHTIH